MGTAPLIHGNVTEQVLGAFFEIYRGFGYGFQEVVYANALAIELGLRSLPVAREAPTQVHWKGHPVGVYRIDLLVAGCVIVEVKSVTKLAEAHERQLMNYLRATDVEVGLLLNFGPESSYKRLVYSNDRKAFSRG